MRLSLRHLEDGEWGDKRKEEMLGGKIRTGGEWCAEGCRPKALNLFGRRDELDIVCLWHPGQKGKLSRRMFEGVFVLHTGGLLPGLISRANWPNRD